MKKLSCIFTTIAIILSDIMCFVVGYQYRHMICGVDHLHFSASPEIAFIYVIPFAVAIIVCVILAIVFYKKSKSK